jgi:hypothetical protein
MAVDDNAAMAAPRRSAAERIELRLQTRLPSPSSLGSEPGRFDPVAPAASMYHRRGGEFAMFPIAELSDSVIGSELRVRDFANLA